MADKSIDRVDSVIVVTSVFLVLSYITTGLRCYVRAVMLSAFWVDDWLIIAVLMAFTVFGAFQVVAVTIGGAALGMSVPGVSFDRRMIGMKYFYLGALFNILAITVFKFAIGTQFLRVCTKRTHIYVIWGIMIISGSVGTAGFFVILFQCRTPSDYWHLEITNRNCISSKILNDVVYMAVSVNAWGDWCFGVLPAFVVWNLHIRRRQKIEVAGLMSFAAIGGVATLVRIRYTIDLQKPEDISWTPVPYINVAAVETGVCIIAASMGTFRPLWHAARNSRSWSLSPRTSRLWNLTGHTKDYSAATRGNSSLTPMTGPMEFGSMVGDGLPHTLTPPAPPAPPAQPVPPIPPILTIPRSKTPPQRPLREPANIIGSIASIMRSPSMQGYDLESQQSGVNPGPYPPRPESREEHMHQPTNYSTNGSDSFHPLRQQPTELTPLHPKPQGRKDSTLLMSLPRLHAPPTRGLPLVTRDMAEKLAARRPISKDLNEKNTMRVPYM